MATPLPKLAIIPMCAELSLAEAASAAAAIQTQVAEHFAPLWHVSALVGALPKPMPGYFPVYVVRDLPPGVSGLHYVDGVPYAYVRYGAHWSLAASHECLEMLADPTANRLWSSTLPNGQPANFIVEVCDPCQDASFGYPIGSWLMSDFVTPGYFDIAPPPAPAYSFARHVTAPREVLRGGTLGWIAGNGHAYQAVNNGTATVVRDRGPFKPGPLPARVYMNRFDQAFNALSSGVPAPSVRRRLARHRREEQRAAQAWQAEIEKDIAAKAALNVSGPRATRKKGKKPR